MRCCTRAKSACCGACSATRRCGENGSCLSCLRFATHFRCYTKVTCPSPRWRWRMIFLSTPSPPARGGHMPRHLSPLGVSSMLLILLLLAPNVRAADPLLAAKAKALLQDRCASCHDQPGNSKGG